MIVLWILGLLSKITKIHQSAEHGVVKNGVLEAKGRKMGVLGGEGRIRQFVFAAGPSTRRYKVALVESSNAQIIGGVIFTA